MPQKKKNTTLVTEDVLVEAVVARVTDQFNLQLDARFARLELAMERGAATPVTPPAPDNTAPARTEKRPAEDAPEEETPAPKRPTQVSVSVRDDSSLSAFAHLGDDRQREPTRTLRPDSHQATRAAMTGAQPTATSAVNNNNSTWTAWQAVADRGRAHHGLSARPGLHSFDSSHLYDTDVDAQVRHILDVTPHQLKGTVPPGFFPFKYITRGPEKKKLSFNTVSLPEHMLGMFRMLEDDRVDPSIKPDILAHMKEVSEDACEYEWAGHVRRWSEEVFDLVAEGRIPGGWSAHTKILNLRTGMSRVDSARLSVHKDNFAHPASSKPAAAAAHRDTVRSSSSHQAEVFRGGPPCPQFNSAQGCHLPSGHVVNGKKNIHVCSYCLLNTAAAHPHSEAHCRTKQRHASHF